MLWLVIGVVTAGGSFVAADLWRRSFRRDQPLALWGREWPSGEAAARGAAEEIGLPVVSVPEDLAWLSDMALAPVWLFWGDLRTRRPERHLRRWRLAGEREGRQVSVAFLAEDARFAVDTPAVSPFWADDPAGGERRGLAEQEGLRALFPVGSERWNEGVAHLGRIFALGITRVAVEEGALVARTRLGEGMAPPAAWAGLLDAMTALAALIER